MVNGSANAPPLVMPSGAQGRSLHLSHPLSTFARWRVLATKYDNRPQPVTQVNGMSAVTRQTLIESHGSIHY